ncbi:MAG: sigma-54 dependent transcriptional regulator [Acidobacteriota bacterium]
MYPVLIVDDQPAIVRALELLFDLHDLPSLSASSPEEAIDVARRHELGAVIQDMNFARNETSGEAGVDLFGTLREECPEVPILLMTAWASLETAVALIKRGASDYIEKPWNDDKLVATVRNLMRLRKLEIENRQLRDQIRFSRDRLARQYDLCGIVYASEAMHELIGLAVSVAGSDAPILITGPNGSGKERVADIVEANSRRAGKAYVKVNLGAIPEDLMESELFGAEPGAYTSQQARRFGRFEAADGGTLFLDELDALSLASQVKLLRVLQSGEFERLGSSKTRRVDVRVISATNSDLTAAIEEGRFREDLYFRLNVIELPVPSLRERLDDVRPLAEHFLETYARRADRDLSLSSEAVAALHAYGWPGNVRELENRIQRATVVCKGPSIGPEELNLDRSGGKVSRSTKRQPDADDLIEKQSLLDAISRADGVIAHAAEELGMSRQALYRRMNRLGIELERRPRESS